MQRIYNDVMVEASQPEPLSQLALGQLQFLLRNSNFNTKTLTKIFNGEPILRNEFETLIKAFYQGICGDRNPSFKLIEFDGSHFSAYIPNIHKVWEYGKNDDYQLSQRNMCTLNAWLFHGASHNDHRLGTTAMERAKQVLQRAGITPKNIAQAQALMPTKNRVSF